jgi:hypothetical protein
MEVRVDTPAADSGRTMGKLEAILNWRNQGQRAHRWGGVGKIENSDPQSDPQNLRSSTT